MSARAVVELSVGSSACGFASRVRRLAVLALREMHEHRLVGQPFQVQRDADAERGRAAEVRVELHSAGSDLHLELAHAVDAGDAARRRASPGPRLRACRR